MVDSGRTEDGGQLQTTDVVVSWWSARINICGKWGREMKFNERDVSRKLCELIIAAAITGWRGSVLPHERVETPTRVAT